MAFYCPCLIIQYSLLLQIYPSLITMSNADTVFCILLLDDINTFWCSKELLCFYTIKRVLFVATSWSWSQTSREAHFSKCIYLFYLKAADLVIYFNPNSPFKSSNQFKVRGKRLAQRVFFCKKKDCMENNISVKANRTMLLMFTKYIINWTFHWGELQQCSTFLHDQISRILK